MSLLVEIVTRERALLTEQADMVVLPGTSGRLGVLEGHAPLLSTLDIGEIVLHHNGEKQYIAVSGGVVQVRPDKVTVLADTAEEAHEIDIERAQAARDRARQMLATTPPTDRHPVMIAALKKSTWRIRVAQRYLRNAPGASSTIQREAPD